MLKELIVKLERETTIGGRFYPSRGYYIVEPRGGRFYLHHDGKIKDGVHTDSDKPAFWETEKEAQLFLEEVRNKK